MNLRLRFVPFGTRFTAALDCSATRSNLEEPTVLHCNELAVDVGGTCLDWRRTPESAPETLPVLDHHFTRTNPELGDENYPAAAAAVLHQAERIRDLAGKAREAKAKSFFLVTHSAPDFDALCSAYLAACLIGGNPLTNDDLLSSFDPNAYKLSPVGWIPLKDASRRFDWYAPSFDDGQNVRWPILLAAYAAAQDQCRALRAPRVSALHSVLYAILKRDRLLPVRGEAGRMASIKSIEGVASFFGAVRERMAAQSLNPLYDNLFEVDGLFGPELAMLQREETLYLRDLKRARIATVTLPVRSAFARWYTPLKELPLLSEDGKIVVKHVADDFYLEQRSVDGVYLRDPECLLFKEWARDDRDHAPRANGFQFTAIVYSDGKTSAKNTGDYYFALDPERSADSTLYPVWARLQAAESLGLGSGDGAGARIPIRPGYEGRGAHYPQAFHDPWFDGASYGCTLVVTPGGGTCLPGGERSDLSDDFVANIVRDELELRLYSGSADKRVTIHDFACAPVNPAGKNDGHPEPAKQVPISEAKDLGTTSNCFRFASIKVCLPDRAFHDRMLAEQIGRQLWPLLEPAGTDTIPSDFSKRHLLVTPEVVFVWNRHGFALAHTQAGAAACDSSRKWLSEVARITQQAESLLSSDTAGAETRGAGTKNKQTYRATILKRLLSDVSMIRLQLSQPQGALYRRFFEAICLSDTLESLNAVAQQDDLLVLVKEAKVSVEAINRTQTKVEYVEVFLIGIYSIYLVNYLGEAFGIHGDYKGWWILLGSSASSLIAFLLLGLHKPHEKGDFEAIRSKPHQPPLFRFAIILLGIVAVALVFIHFGRPAAAPTESVQKPAESHGAPAKSH